MGARHVSPNLKMRYANPVPNVWYADQTQIKDHLLGPPVIKSWANRHSLVKTIHVVQLRTKARLNSILQSASHTKILKGHHKGNEPRDTPAHWKPSDSQPCAQ